MSSEESNIKPDEENIITPEVLKEKGNQSVKEKNYKQAITFYSDALKMSPNHPDNYILYSNRSFVYLKVNSFYYALSDAEKVIELRPDFVKGYFRKAEVMKECCQYDEAILNYGRALKLEPNNNIIITNLRITAGLCNREIMLEKNVPFVGSGCGVIFAIIVVILDQLTKTPTLKNPIVMVLLVILVAGIGFLIAKTFRYYLKLHRKGLIEPPTTLSDEFLIQDPSSGDAASEEENPKKRNRYSKSQARFRFKKGKS